MQTLSFISAAPSRVQQKPWILPAFDQLVRIAAAAQAMRNSDELDEDLTPSSPELLNASSGLLLALYERVPNAPDPTVTADPFSGDITILFEDSSHRLELIVHNAEIAITCLLTDASSSRKVDDPKIIFDALTQLAA